MILALLLSIATARPAPQPAPEQVPLAVSNDTGMDQCPAFTHYHAAGPDKIQDGKCHDDTTDAPMLSAPPEREPLILPRGVTK